MLGGSGRVETAATSMPWLLSRAGISELGGLVEIWQPENTATVKTRLQ
jgi:hypothetical protein